MSQLIHHEISKKNCTPIKTRRYNSLNIVSKFSGMCKHGVVERGRGKGMGGAEKVVWDISKSVSARRYRVNGRKNMSDKNAHSTGRTP